MQSSSNMMYYISIDIKKNLHVTLLSKKKCIKEYSWYGSIYIKQYISIFMVRFQLFRIPSFLLL